MRRPIPAAVFLFSLVFAGVGNAAFRIALKGGREFITDQYWEEGNQIKFNYYGGVVGVAKDSVSKIEKTNAPAKAGTAAKTAPDEMRTKEGAGQVDIESYREKKSELRRKFDEASEKYRDAIRKQDLPGKEKASEEMREFSRQAYDLADELREKNKGVLPDWWEEKER
jgi:predicted transcriptional regulator